MNNYFLGFFPDEKSNHKIRKVVGEVGRVFDGQDIKVRWSNPDQYHVTLLYLGNNLNILERWQINRKLRNLIIPKFSMSFDRCELGIGKNNREVIYLSIKSGGDHLRSLVFSLRNSIKSSDFHHKIHHLTLGRVNKDLGNEEFLNLASDLRNSNLSIKLDEITLSSENLWLVRSNNDGYSFIKKFETA